MITPILVFTLIIIRLPDSSAGAAATTAPKPTTTTAPHKFPMTIMEFQNILKAEFPEMLKNNTKFLNIILRPNDTSFDKNDDNSINHVEFRMAEQEVNRTLNGVDWEGNVWNGTAWVKWNGTTTTSKPKQ